jgi:serine/threonine-protein phosphatase PGAM5
MFERIVYLVRHGQCEPQIPTSDYVDVALTALGREQAAATAERLRPLKADALYCSTLARARQTAEILAMHFPALTLRASMLLRELPWAGAHEDDTWRQLFEARKRRGTRAFTYYVRPSHSSEAVHILVTHGNLIRYFVCCVLGKRPESMSAFGTSHCGITQLRVFGDGRVRLISYNDTGHLPGSLRS